MEYQKYPQNWQRYFIAFWQSGLTYSQVLQAVNGDIISHKPGDTIGNGVRYFGPSGRIRSKQISGAERSGDIVAIACFRLLARHKPLSRAVRLG